MGVTFTGGIKIEDEKALTRELKIQECAAPEFVHIPLTMHIGAEAKAVVNVGDKVKLGQVIGKAEGFVSSNVHASVSGIVTEIKKKFLPNGSVSHFVVIKNDFLDTLDENIRPLDKENLTAEGIRQAMQACGIVGMGGATFPTHVKYAPPKDGKKITTVILNGIECEPYITADHRVMLDYAKDVINGLRYFMLAAGAENGVIAVEENKPDAIAFLKDMVNGENDISVVACKEKYPQGSEKQLVQAVTGKIIPDRGLPSSVGVIVDNVSTAAWTARAVETGMPCYQRVLTVNGNGVKKPGNYLVRIGTLYSDVVKECGGTDGEIVRVISGGPMMGFSLNSLDYPVTKGCNGILLFNSESGLSEILEERNCVRCGKCVEVCPMGLEPTRFVHAVKRSVWALVLKENISTCVECGACAYVCPAHIPIVQYIRMGKQFVMTKGMGEKNPLYKL